MINNIINDLMSIIINHQTLVTAHMRNTQGGHLKTDVHVPEAVGKIKGR
jgi:hypothetical protein